MEYNTECALIIEDLLELKYVLDIIQEPIGKYVFYSNIKLIQDIKEYPRRN